VKRGFTLIESLVVVAITVTLIALLLPAVGRFKVESARAISAHTLDQLITAGRLYFNDHDNRTWPYEVRNTQGAQWWYGFETPASLSMPEGQRTCDYSRSPLGQYMIASGGVTIDPALLQYSPRLKPKYQDGNYGYGYNTVLASDTNGNPRNVLSVTAPSQMIVFATCAQVNNFQLPASPANPMVEAIYQIDTSDKTAHFRHGRDALAAFLDGSVRSLSMDTDMVPGSQDMRMPSANIGVFNSSYITRPGW
jgi:prepilin-type N-terminal cleavage/methylation domain-containing protein